MTTANPQSVTERLSWQQIRWLRMRLLSHQTPAVIAAAEGVTEEAVHQCLNRARRTLGVATLADAMRLLAEAGVTPIVCTRAGRAELALVRA